MQPRAQLTDDKTTQGLGEGALLDNRFVLEQIVGSGGAGIVFSALDRFTDERVAIKVLRRPSEDDVERFYREIRALNQIRHDAIVRSIADGTTPDGRPYLAMELVEGETLAERLSRGALSGPDTITVAKRIAEGLAVAHAAGALHRDVKPANVILCGGALERAKLLDFGLVRRQEDPIRSRVGSLLGTPAYIAPEQARGERALDARADVFSLGCVLYECLCGAQAFGGTGVLEVLSKVLLEEPMPLEDRVPSVDLGLARLVAKMLTKERSGRPADGALVLKALHDLSQSIHVTPGRRVRIVHATRTVAASAKVLWGIFVDTNRWDRHCRAPESWYSEVPDASSETGVRRVGSATMAGMDAQWLEVGEALEGRSMTASRVFITGPFAEIKLEIRLQAQGSLHTQADCSLSIYQHDEQPEPLAEYLIERMSARLASYLDAIERLTRDAPRLALSEEQGVSATALSQRLILAHAAGDPVFAGPKSTADDVRLAEASDALRDRLGLDAAVVERVLQFLADASDDFVREFRASELAEAWDTSLQELIAVLVAAMQVGLVTMRWRVLCSNCRVSMATVPQLDRLQRATRCAECGQSTHTDLATNVEAVFGIHPAIRSVQSRVYCASSAAFRPHVAGFFVVPANGTAEQLLPTTMDAVAVRAIRRGHVCVIEREARAAGPIHLVLSDESLHVQPALSAGGSAVTGSLVIANHTHLSAEIQLEYVALPLQQSAVTVASVPAFADYLSLLAPPRSVELTVSHVELAVVVYALVLERCGTHGELATYAALAACTARLGALVGTAGAILTSDETSHTWLLNDRRSFVAAVERWLTECRAQDVHARVRMHAGPCYASRHNDRLSLFGQGIERARRDSQHGPLGLPL
jgi:hypothetical protein